MTFEIEVNGRVRSVSIERAGGEGRFRVSVDGETTLVEAQRNGGFGLSLLFPDEAHRTTRVSIAPGTARGAADASGAAHGEQRVSAPMPGRVVRVLVAQGDDVEARQPVVVVEAMKMENELRSPKTGRVKEVTVAAGTSVEAGRVLVVID